MNSRGVIHLGREMKGGDLGRLQRDHVVSWGSSKEPPSPNLVLALNWLLPVKAEGTGPGQAGACQALAG